MSKLCPCCQSELIEEYGVEDSSVGGEHHQTEYVYFICEECDYTTEDLGESELCM